MAVTLPSHKLLQDEKALRAYLQEVQAQATQDVFVAFEADSGAAVPDSATDTIVISGGAGIFTSVTSDVLTINNDFTGESEVTAAADDFILVSDTSDSNIIKKVRADTIAQTTNEYLVSEVLAGSAISLTTNVTATITSLVLTAGDWDIRGEIAFTLGATTSVTRLQGAISLTDAVMPTIASNVEPGFNFRIAANVLGGTPAFGIPTGRNNGGLVTIYLVVAATFTVSTVDAYGFISARRCG